MPELDDDTLLSAFASSRLPEDAWTHRAHLRVAWLHLERDPIDEAHRSMRVGIIRLNAAHGLVETAARGYHETITRAWLEIIALLRGPRRCETSGAFVDIHRDRLTKDALLAHYSREVLGSPRARAVWVAPDRSPFGHQGQCATE